MSRFAGTRVIVVGGGGGIGGRIAERFSEEGADAIVLDLARGDSSRESGDAAEPARGILHCDLVDSVSVEAAFAVALAELGGVDVLVNSAGILARGSLLDLAPERWDLVMDINARGTLFAMQHAARAMIEQGTGGTIVNIASMAAKAGGADEGAYAASKAAVVGLTRAAALEWGEHQIRVNALLPGYVLTDMGKDTRTDEDVANWSKKSPLGRLGTPDDVAGFALFLASVDGGYLTGQSFNVTGGMIMH
ncbi:3-oxoacyl-[acyl-carrier protein] reductase [Agreia bicolorata]|uniref:3-oxoacyl-[acyl-carrier protein] reductase n=1 Tax=Agreia bicolorata TaxID=110935 RepID=A0A1T4YPN9_9MICO|nr:SDR family oxidoreductase [Agreia bicolorata]SKB03231.1 3-oxoacyl-[acyl-carrier protein] reductase [Agreia bicolorata]